MLVCLLIRISHTTYVTCDRAWSLRDTSQTLSRFSAPLVLTDFTDPFTAGWGRSHVARTLQEILKHQHILPQFPRVQVLADTESCAPEDLLPKVKFISLGNESFCMLFEGRERMEAPGALSVHGHCWCLGNFVHTRISSPWEHHQH